LNKKFQRGFHSEALHSASGMINFCPVNWHQIIEGRGYEMGQVVVIGRHGIVGQFPVAP
jgi:hypothetical protein